MNHHPGYDAANRPLHPLASDACRQFVRYRDKLLAVLDAEEARLSRPMRTGVPSPLYAVLHSSCETVRLARSILRGINLPLTISGGSS